MGAWKWAAASTIGSSHVKTASRKQDAYRCLAVDGTIIAVVADGAGSASMGGEGASIVCRTMVSEARKHLKVAPALPDDEQMRSWIDVARDRIGIAAAGQGTEPRDFASTLVLLISTGCATMIAHVGDGCAVIRSRADDSWSAASWPEQGEYVSTTFFVTDEPEPRLRVTHLDEPLSAFAIMTDGIERLALDFATQSAHGPFFEGMIKPVVALACAGKDNALSAGLDRFGPATASVLSQWRQRHEARFKYDPQPNAQDRQEIARIGAEFSAKGADLRRKLTAGAIDLRNAVQTFTARARQPDPVLARLHFEKEQAAADLGLLGMPIPAVRRRSRRLRRVRHLRFRLVARVALVHFRRPRVYPNARLAEVE